MPLQIKVIPHQLKFKFDARTSRGAMQNHQVYYLQLSSTDLSEIYGVGECAPLPGLSPEYDANFGYTLNSLVSDLNKKLNNNNSTDLESYIYQEIFKDYPSVVFALETAWLDFKNGGKRLLYQNEFTQSGKGIPINGLIWMGNKDFMQEQIKQKLQAGYSCLKLKIGGLDFATELEILKFIRQVASADSLTIRLDANGGFKSKEALSRLEALSQYQIHSIEQPIKPGQWDDLFQLCRHAPIPIALDEELIGIKTEGEKDQLLEAIKPQYIILKPTLVGGLQETKNWIELAEKRNISWWITSALESNIGLNAISQFTANYPIQLEQGLGTGQLYNNNIASPLSIHAGNLYYDNAKSWDSSLINN